MLLIEDCTCSSGLPAKVEVFSCSLYTDKCIRSSKHIELAAKYRTCDLCPGFCRLQESTSLKDLKRLDPQ